MTAATQPTPVPSLAAKRTEAYRRAIVRACEAGLVGYKLSNLAYEVPSVSQRGNAHIVRVTGTRWFDLACDCAGSTHLACVHRAIALWCIRNRTSARRPVIAPIDVPATVAAPAVVAAREASVAAVETAVAAQSTAWNLFGAVPPAPAGAYVGWVSSENPNLPVHLQAEAARLDALNARATAIFQGAR